jgi:hypothetical protein
VLPQQWFVYHLSWFGIDLSNATNDIGLQRARAKQIHEYVAGFAKNVLIIQSELLQQSQPNLVTMEDLNLIKSAYMTKAEAVYKLHASLGHLPYSRIERMILKGIMKGYTFDLKLLKQLLNTKCDICLRAKITDAGHKGTLFHADEPWHTFSFDITGPLQQRSIHDNFYMGAIMDTASKFVFPSFIETKHEVHDKLSWFFETYIVELRGRLNTNYKIFLITDLGEAHTNKIIKTCRKFGIVKQSTAGYTPDYNAFSEKYFGTVEEMSRCQMLQFNCEEELWED